MLSITLITLNDFGWLWVLGEQNVLLAYLCVLPTTANKEIILPNTNYGESNNRRSLSCLLLFVIPILMPLASRASMAAFAAPSDPFFCLVQARCRVPNACTLVTAIVKQMGGGGH